MRSLGHPARPTPHRPGRRSPPVAALGPLALAMLAAGACSGAKGDDKGDGDDGGIGTEGLDGSGGEAAGGDGSGGDASGGDASGGGPRFDALEGDDDDAGGTGECNRVLTAIVRDFSDAHPDFQYTTGVDPGIVEVDLGGDGLPVYAGDPTTPTTNGQEHFDQWYRTTSGFNVELSHQIELVEGDPGEFGFDDSEFFPIDGLGFGNEGREHNYHFTLELRTRFTYRGGEIFTFRGDDDLFVFVNGKLALDLGGVHGPLEGTIDLDAQAAALGIDPGGEYALDFFFAERHTTQSNFRIQTTIECLENPPIG